MYRNLVKLGPSFQSVVTECRNTSENTKLKKKNGDRDVFYIQKVRGSTSLRPKFDARRPSLAVEIF